MFWPRAQVPLKEVAEKYGLGKEKGPLEGLQERAGEHVLQYAGPSQGVQIKKSIGPGLLG